MGRPVRFLHVFCCVSGKRHYISIRPKALTIKLVRIMTAKKGQTKRIMVLNAHLLRKGSPFSVISWAMRSKPMARETRM